MPLYEYKCNACGNDFEELVFSEPEKVKCPTCGSTDTRRLVSAGCVKTSGGALAASAFGGGGCGNGRFT